MWKAELPSPSTHTWREAYGTSEQTAQTSYKAPGKQPIPFVYDTVKISGGLVVDTAEYPFFGLWSSTTLNEKPQSITVSGFLRGDKYIANRNALIEALRIVTSDENPGYIHLPLWGRFPVVVIEWNIDEGAKENGQCKIDIRFVRAGVSIEQRKENKNNFGKTIEESAELVQKNCIDIYAANLQGKIDDSNLMRSFIHLKTNLISIVGRIQGSQKILNKLTNEIMGMTNLLAQGIRSPKALAQALFSACNTLTFAIAEIKNATEENIAFFRIRDNEKKILHSFLSQHSFFLDIEAVTIKQSHTKKETENLYKTASFYIASLILPVLNVQTRETALELWTLYTRLEKSLDLNNPTMYMAIVGLRSTIATQLSAKRLSQELSISLAGTMPLLALAQYVGTEAALLKELNRIEDSFIIGGHVNYV